MTSVAVELSATCNQYSEFNVTKIIPAKKIDYVYFQFKKLTLVLFKMYG